MALTREDAESIIQAQEKNQVRWFSIITPGTKLMTSCSETGAGVRGLHEEVCRGVLCFQENGSRVEEYRLC